MIGALVGRGGGIFRRSIRACVQLFVGPSAAHKCRSGEVYPFLLPPLASETLTLMPKILDGSNYLYYDSSGSHELRTMCAAIRQMSPDEIAARGVYCHPLYPDSLMFWHIVPNEASRSPRRSVLRQDHLGTQTLMCRFVVCVLPKAIADRMSL